MVTVVKHEWHQVDSQFAYELTKEILEEIYPDMDEDELEELWQQVENGEADIDEILNEAWNNDVEIEWDRQYDDWWTERKGGYDVTYEYGDEDSWVEPPKDPEPTHKCTKCRWTGQSYNTLTQHLREDGTVIEDYYSSEEESHSEKDVCPMCDSDTELTEVGVKEAQERAEREARWAAMDAKKSEENLEGDPCYSCDKVVAQEDLIEMDGQYICPHCGEGWVDMDNREDDEQKTKELEEALEELKREFEMLSEEDQGNAEYEGEPPTDEEIEEQNRILNEMFSEKTKK